MAGFISSLQKGYDPEVAFLTDTGIGSLCFK